MHAGQVCRSPRAWTGPTSANIEVTNLCNIECITCRRTSWGKGRSVGNMSLEQFGCILREMPTLKHATLTGIGEPLINKNLIGMLRLARDGGVVTSFVTNGTLLSRQPEGTLRELRELAAQVSVSLDSPNPEEFETIRVRAKFDQVIAGIRVLAAVGRTRDLAPVRVNMVVLDSTVGRMGEMVTLCSELGVDVVTFTPVMEYRRDVGLWSQHHVRDQVHFADAQRAARELGRRLGVTVTTEVVANPALAPLLGCAAPWSSVAVTFDGYVCPCCMLNDSDEIHFGNLFETPFAEIWNGEPYRAFRQRFGFGRVPCECSAVKCHVAAAITARAAGA